MAEPPTTTNSVSEAPRAEARSAANRSRRSVGDGAPDTMASTSRYATSGSLPSIRRVHPGDTPQPAVFLRKSFELPVIGKPFPFQPGWPGHEPFRPEAVQARLPLPHARGREPLLEGRDPHTAQEEASKIRIGERVAPHARSIRYGLDEVRFRKVAEDPVHLRWARPRRLREFVSGLRHGCVREQTEDPRPRFSPEHPSECRLKDGWHR